MTNIESMFIPQSFLNIAFFLRDPKAGVGKLRSGGHMRSVKAFNPT